MLLLPPPGAEMPQRGKQYAFLKLLWEEIEQFATFSPVAAYHSLLIATDGSQIAGSGAKGELKMIRIAARGRRTKRKHPSQSSSAVIVVVVVRSFVLSSKEDQPTDTLGIWRTCQQFFIKYLGISVVVRGLTWWHCGTVIHLGRAAKGTD
ncbi:monooxygenase [Anopheles sinensis]|uniref:Monooxygenase n=1 Tax=Anopheles sinensis TaxID=74873 RepID=A0A084VKN9_ANOSI|nr:monooxygenase [Anopheles sinensis]